MPASGCRGTVTTSDPRLRSNLIWPRAWPAHDTTVDATLKLPAVMTVAEFLAWNAPSGGHWQLVDGEPSAMSLPSLTHGAIQSQLGYLIAGHLNVPGNPCSVITTPGIVARVRANENFLIPDLAVTCTRYESRNTMSATPC